MAWFAALSPVQRSGLRALLPRKSHRRSHAAASTSPRGADLRELQHERVAAVRAEDTRVRPVCEGEHERADGRVVVFAEDRVGAGADLFRRGHALELGDEVWGWACEPAGVACLAVELLAC
jgi:hypothetical protein